MGMEVSNDLMCKHLESEPSTTQARQLLVKDHFLLTVFLD
jgi:hypothetical protein